MNARNDALLNRMGDRDGDSRDFDIIITEADDPVRPTREWECTMCGSWINWPGLPMIPCFHCNTRHKDIDGPLYVPRSKSGGESE